MLIKQMNQSLYQPLLVYLDKGFRFQIYVCNDCNNLLMVSTNRDAILTELVKKSRKFIAKCRFVEKTGAL